MLMTRPKRRKKSISRTPRLGSKALAGGLALCPGLAAWTLRLELCSCTHTVYGHDEGMRSDQDGDRPDGHDGLVEWG